MSPVFNYRTPFCESIVVELIEPRAVNLFIRMGILINIIVRNDRRIRRLLVESMPDFSLFHLADFGRIGIFVLYPMIAN